MVDDHNLLRAGLASVFNSFDDITVVGEAGGSKELEALLERGVQPDIVLMDIQLDNETGIELTQWLTETHPEIKVVGLTVSDEQSDIIELVQAGAKGYVLKTTDQKELHTCLKMVANGGTFYGSGVTEALLSNLQPGERKLSAAAASTATLAKDTDPRARADIPMRREPKPDIEITPREQEIVILVAKEHTTAEIAEVLGISPRTVENHRYRISQKLGVKGAAGLAKYAIKSGLI